MGLLTFHEEFQFARRLRVREGLYPTMYGYIQQGNYNERAHERAHL